MSAWVMIAALAVLTALVKAAGPVLVGGRSLPAWASRVITLLPPVLLAALVVTSAFADGQRLRLDASSVGLAVAGVMLWRRLPLLLCVLTAVAVTAAVRAVP